MLLLLPISYVIGLFTDRELELRELRKVVLSSQEENMSLNKEMEELKVHLLECVHNYLTRRNGYTCITIFLFPCCRVCYKKWKMILQQ